MGIRDLIPDSLLEIGSDQVVAIRLDENLFDIGIDSLIEFEPDTITKTFSIAPIIEFTFNPGQTFYSSFESFTFGDVEAQLSQAILKSGKLILIAENSIDGDLNFILNIPKAKKNGESLSIIQTVPGSSGSQNGILQYEFDISDYVLDLTGQSGNVFNELDVQFILSNPLTGEPITAYNTDTVHLSLSYSDLELKFATGYFGSESISLTEGSIIDAFDEFNDVSIGVDEVNAELIFTNGFGIDIQASIFQFKAMNSLSGNSLNLSHDLIGSNINLSRSGLSGYEPIPYQKNYTLNNSNSNITSFLELLPDSIFINANANLNPFGNISNYNDFISSESRLRCDIALTIPLKFSLSNLSIRDTTELNWPENENFTIQSGNLFLQASNSFPVNITLKIKALDHLNNTVLDLNTYLVGSIGLIPGRQTNESTLSLLKFSLSEDAVAQLKTAKKLAITGNFETTNYPENVIFNESDSLKIKIITDLNSTLSF